MIDFDWTANSANAWTVPVGANFGKAFNLGSQAMTLQLGSYDYIKQPNGNPGVVSFPLHSALRTPNLKPSIWPASSISSATLNSERPAPTATEPINSARTGPTRWQRLHTTFPVAKPDSVLAPIPAVGDRLKLLLEQRMIGMHYSDRSLVSVPLWRI